MDSNYKDHAMTHREIFVYLLVSLIKDPTIQALGVDKRTVILNEMRKKMCPTVTDDDLGWIAKEIDSNNPEVQKLLFSLIDKKDFAKLYVSIMDRFTKK